MIKANCPSCFQQYEVEESAVGTYADCLSCGKRFRVQAASPVGNAPSGGGCNPPERVSMALPLVFQSIVLGLIALSTLFFFADAFGAMEFMEWVFPVIAILNIVFTTMFHYKCWDAMPAGFARLAPGKAAGYLFIPFFSLYWAFPSIGGLGADCAACAKSKGLRGVNYLRGLGLTLAILMCVVGAFWAFCGLTLDPEMLRDSADDISNLGMFLWFWALGGAPVIGLLLATARFVIWLLFYRGVTRLLNGAAAPAATTLLR